MKRVFYFARVQFLCVVWLLAAGVWLLAKPESTKKLNETQTADHTQAVEQEAKIEQ